MHEVHSRNKTSSAGSNLKKSKQQMKTCTPESYTSKHSCWSCASYNLFYYNQFRMGKKTKEYFGETKANEDTLHFTPYLLDNESMDIATRYLFSIDSLGIGFLTDLDIKKVYK